MDLPTTSSCPPNDRQPPWTWIFLALFLLLLLAWFCYIIKRLCWRVPSDKDHIDDTYEDIDGADYTNVSLVTMPTTGTRTASNQLPLLEPSRQLHYINMPNFHIGAFSEIQCPVNGISKSPNDSPIVHSNATERGCIYVNDLKLKRHLKKRKFFRSNAFRKTSQHYYSNIKDVTFRFKKDPPMKYLRTLNSVSKQLCPTKDEASTSQSSQVKLEVPDSNQLCPTQDEASTSQSSQGKLKVPDPNQLCPTQDEASTSQSSQGKLKVPDPNQLCPTQDEASTSQSSQGKLKVPDPNHLSPTGDTETLPEGINSQCADLPEANVRSCKNVHSCNAASKCETPLLETSTTSRSRPKPMHYFKRRTKPSDCKVKDGAQRRFLFTSYTLHVVGRFSHVFNMVDLPYIED
ncbi:hypothetical protein BgiMline_035566 [Biomphalaria glabrata]|uniref:Uncharacterized protein LOC129923592 n=1 Tax=Biomphalaria glabrata TaxID=6526 RepID=A0A9W2Z839_BIOGL|nr:uncharacterized protein LOC129923592 [Biomphalaria glabrata]KAI8730529.1 hypothetical protein BgiMline_030874 [Biomphalaria glabrata]